MNWHQKRIRLQARSRGFHLVTCEIVEQLDELQKFQVGMLHLFLQHTSAALTLNENADPEVRVDMEMAINHLCPEELPYTHTLEGPDDMPAHVKSSLLGHQLMIPISQGRLALGTWQGIYLCEHRNRAGSRQVVCTIFGENQPG